MVEIEKYEEQTVLTSMSTQLTSSKSSKVMLWSIFKSYVKFTR